MTESTDTPLITEDPQSSERAHEEEDGMSEPGQPEDEPLDDVDTEVVEDLDVDEDAHDVKGGTSWACMTN